LADENKSGELKISSEDELRDWLKSLPPEQGRWVAVAIAARAALRVAPLVATDAERKRSVLNLAFVTFFAAASARTASKYPAHAGRLHVRHAAHAPADASLATSIPSANAAARSASQAAGAAAEAAALAANTASTFSGAANNVVGGYNVAGGYADSAPGAAVWSAVSTDANFIAQGSTAQVLASLRLWPDGAPRWASEHWLRLRAVPQGKLPAPTIGKAVIGRNLARAPREDDWHVWIDWYERRLEGASDPEEIGLIFATVPDKEREAGPATANKWIRERLEKFGWRPAPNLSNSSPPDLNLSPLAADPPITPHAWDFFISYSALDEADAREVAAVLEEAGHSTFARFKDIATGNNFVREMQSGLDGSGRMIALYSP
jgi:hypothetical protein